MRTPIIQQLTQVSVKWQQDLFRLVTVEHMALINLRDKFYNNDKPEQHKM